MSSSEEGSSQLWWERRSARSLSCPLAKSRRSSGSRRGAGAGTSRRCIRGGARSGRPLSLLRSRARL
eukprot:1559768-Rhodomonas_salina.1